jgi:hypothetical protein
MGIRAQKGDWFIGITAINRGNRLVFAMQVSEVLPFEHYYNDPRFEQKKPIIDGTWRQRCGDNMYYKDDAGIWKQHPSIYHCTPEQVEQDLKHPYVFIAELFYYFGDRAIEIPPEYRELIWRRQGCKCEHDLDTVRDFLNWLEANFEPGIHGEPYHKQRGRCKPVR